MESEKKGTGENQHEKKIPNRVLNPLHSTTEDGQSSEFSV